METSLEAISLHRKPKAIPTFLKKTFSMLSVESPTQDPANSALVRWAESGIGFLVVDEEAFARDVLPKYFKHNKYTSFVRQVLGPTQLNMYNFHKVRDSASGSYFLHECFDRHNEARLAQIRRKPELKKPKDY